MTNKGRNLMLGSGILLLLGFLAHVGLGSSNSISVSELITELLKGPQEGSVIVWQFRIPRAIQCVLTGAILGTTGSVFQSLFRNPLAEPYIVGTASGAAVGGALVTAFGYSAFAFGLAMPVAGFFSGLLSLWVVMRLATRRGTLETPTLLLAGVVAATLLSSLLSLIILASGRDQGIVLRWMLGSESEAFWSTIAALTITFVLGFVLLYRLSRKLNALSLGEETARTVGVDLVRTRNSVLGIGTAMTAVLVGAVGIIGFVGLVAPHIARKLGGVDLRVSLPLSSLFGSLIVLFADAIAQRGGQGAGYPVGIVTAMIGAPVLLWLLKDKSNQ
jgi:iron complex transport system permease protein